MKAKRLLLLGMILLIAIAGPQYAEADTAYRKIFQDADYMVRLETVNQTTARDANSYYPPEHPYYEPPPPTKTSSASGFVIEYEGEKYIMTAAHIMGDKGADGIVSITVYFRSGLEESVHAELVGYDKMLDVALLKFSDQIIKNVPTVKLGDSSQLQVGDQVVALGFPSALNTAMALTTGGVINLNAGFNQGINIPTAIVHDCLINRGNSGGPLINNNGEVVGINFLLKGNSPYSYLSSPYSVATPISYIKEILPKLREGGEVQHFPPFLKFDYSGHVNPETLKIDEPPRTGVVVTDVSKNSLADKAGFKVGDLVVSCDGQAVKNLAALYHKLYMETDLTKQFVFEVERGSATVTIKLSLQNKAP